MTFKANGSGNRRARSQFRIERHGSGTHKSGTHLSLVGYFLLSFGVIGCCVTVAAQEGARDGQWRSYGGDGGATRYAALDQINAANVRDLRIRWRWSSPDNAIRNDESNLIPGRYKTTPLMADGVIYVGTSFNLVCAIDATTGETLWEFDPQVPRLFLRNAQHRGIAYWSDGNDRRIFISTWNAYLYAIDAETGELVRDFGDDGRIDLTKGLGRPVARHEYPIMAAPAVCRDVIMTGCSISDAVVKNEMPPGHIRGFDARTGEQKWIFRTIPQSGEYGNDTWLNDSWRYTGNTNAWASMTVDEELGYVYVPLSAPTNDFYGGMRLGDNLFSQSLVCLNAATGERVWHYQMVHHGLWDYDLGSSPVLIDVPRGNSTVRVVAQVTKHGFCFIFDRVTGEPIWPIEEREVTQSSVVGERTAATQPFPTKPLAFERQGFSEDDIIDFTPALRDAALKILERLDYGPLFTPPNLTRPTIYMPGTAGGANWGGAAADPETGILYVPSITQPLTIRLHRPDPNRSKLKYTSTPLPVFGPNGLPLCKPPYGRITAIDLVSGTHRWQVPHGEGPRNHPALKDLHLPRLGSPFHGYPLLTKSLLFVAQDSYGLRGTMSDDERTNFRAYDKTTGEIVHETRLPANVSAPPITYMIDNTQYVVVAIGGRSEPAELIALSLE